jgi:hypothetical protein
MPTLAQLRDARDEFKKIEPRDFFYWSVTKLVAAVLDADTEAGKIDELVRALMMLLTTWNKNYYRFFESRKGGTSLEQHFADLERVISKYFERLAGFRGQRLHEVADLPEDDIRRIFHDFADVLGRVGAAQCLHLLAPDFFPLWDAAILKGYGMENSPYRSCTDAERYVAFMKITKTQLNCLGDFSSLTDNPLKSLDEYNYCSFTKKIAFA